MNETAHIVKVGDWLPGVAAYSFTYEDIDGEGTTRTEDGYMHREIVRSDVLHASVTHVVDQANAITIGTAIKQDSEVAMSLFAPGKRGTYIDGTFYVSKYDGELIRYQDADWWRISYTIVEV